MVLSTITYTNLDTIVRDYPSNIENNGGDILDTDLGSLPATSLIARQNGVVTVTVFEADTPFAVGFGGDVAPAKVVAAAEALLNSQS
ncbi:MAG: hypothetical protein GEU79_16370 [Acidimicrobiia bacterium]|nr:hypothetical protein [Acidimicrobiia bacterium]